MVAQPAGTQAQCAVVRDLLTYKGLPDEPLARVLVPLGLARCPGGGVLREYPHARI